MACAVACSPLIEPDVRISRIRLSCELSPGSGRASNAEQRVWRRRPLAGSLHPYSMVHPSSGTPFVVRCTLTVAPLRSTGISRFLATMGASDFRPEPCGGLWFRRRRWVWLAPPHPGGSPRFLDLSFCARRTQPPRIAPRVHTLIASARVSGRPYSGRETANDLRNEAESVSLALQLAHSPSRASQPTVTRGHAGSATRRMSNYVAGTFHPARKARLSLAHRNTRRRLNGKHCRHMPCDDYCTSIAVNVCPSHSLRKR